MDNYYDDNGQQSEYRDVPQGNWRGGYNNRGGRGRAYFNNNAKRSMSPVRQGTSQITRRWQPGRNNFNDSPPRRVSRSPIRSRSPAKRSRSRSRERRRSRSRSRERRRSRSRSRERRRSRSRSRSHDRNRRSRSRERSYNKSDQKKQDDRKQDDRTNPEDEDQDMADAIKNRQPAKAGIKINIGSKPEAPKPAPAAPKFKPAFEPTPAPPKPQEPAKKPGKNRPISPIFVEESDDDGKSRKKHPSGQDKKSPPSKKIKARLMAVETPPQPVKKDMIFPSFLKTKWDELNSDILEPFAYIEGKVVKEEPVQTSKPVRRYSPGTPPPINRVKKTEDKGFDKTSDTSSFKNVEQGSRETSRTREYTPPRRGRHDSGPADSVTSRHSVTKPPDSRDRQKMESKPTEDLEPQYVKPVKPGDWDYEQKMQRPGTSADEEDDFLYGNDSRGKQDKKKFSDIQNVIFNDKLAHIAGSSQPAPFIPPPQQHQMYPNPEFNQQMFYPQLDMYGNPIVQGPPMGHYYPQQPIRQQFDPFGGGLPNIRPNLTSTRTNLTTINTSNLMVVPTAELQKNEQRVQVEEQKLSANGDDKGPICDPKQLRRMLEESRVYCKKLEEESRHLIADREALLKEAELYTISEHEELLMRNRTSQNDVKKKLYAARKESLEWENTLQKIQRGEIAVPVINEPRNVGNAKPEISKEPELQKYIFVDIHDYWCKPCSFVGTSAKAYIDHLMTDKHRQYIHPDDKPWMRDLKVQKNKAKIAPNAVNAPMIGLEFLMPTNAFYCKLCSCWAGYHDTTEEEHIKSAQHYENYQNYKAKSPLYEQRRSAEKKEYLQKQKEEAAAAPKQQANVGGGAKGGNEVKLQQHRNAVEELSRKRIEAEKLQQLKGRAAELDEMNESGLQASQNVAKQGIKLRLLDKQQEQSKPADAAQDETRGVAVGYRTMSFDNQGRPTPTPRYPNMNSMPTSLRYM